MYGYFKPRSSGLTDDEVKLFNSYYCRICYCLRILGGQTARFLTTFDVAIYSLVLQLAQRAPTPPPVKCRWFSAKPMKNYENDELGLRLARLSFIIFGEKIRDDHLDGDKAKAMGMDLFFKKKIALSCAAEPELQKIAFDGTNRINEMQDNAHPVDSILDTYGDMVADMFGVLCPLEEEYRQLIRHIAIWTFYVDMLNDYAKDYKAGKYNGFKVEGCECIQSCFNKNYLIFLNLNRRINRNIISLLGKVCDGSPEWTILNKILSCAIGTTAYYILKGYDVEFSYFKGCKNIPRLIKYGKGKSNFR